MKRQAILYLSTKSNAWSIEAFDTLQKVEDADVFFAYHQMEEELPKVLEGLNTFCFTNSILHDLGYSPIEESILPGSNHFPLLKFYKEHTNYDYYWMVEDDVRFSGEWNDCFKDFSDNSSDFLSAYTTLYHDAPNWYWWYTLETGKEDIPKDKRVKSFNPIYRLSNKALQCIDTHLRQGWKGHHECLIPTLLYNKGFSIEDFGGEGIFVKDTKKKRYYDEETFGLRPVLPDNNQKDMLFHPVKEEKVAAPIKNNCVFIPTGDNSLHRQLLQGEADFDLHLLIYDKSYNKWCNDTAYIGADSGYKMDMTYRYLQRHPEYLEHYEYFFLMDDDIKMPTEEVNKLFRYMREYHLRIAQPSLVMSYYTYEHTLHNPTCILRYTNFVEMMMPCFSREALKLVLPTFEKKVRWMGIEWHWSVLINTNKKDIAIIDDIKAVHGRQIYSYSKDCNRLTGEYLQTHNLNYNIYEWGYKTQETPQLYHIQFLITEKSKFGQWRHCIELDFLEILKMAGGKLKSAEVVTIVQLCYIVAVITQKKKYQDFAEIVLKTKPANMNANVDNARKMVLEKCNALLALLYLCGIDKSDIVFLSKNIFNT